MASCFRGSARCRLPARPALSTPTAKAADGPARLDQPAAQSALIMMRGVTVAISSCRAFAHPDEEGARYVGAYPGEPGHDGKKARLSRLNLPAVCSRHPERRFVSNVYSR